MFLLVKKPIKRIFNQRSQHCSCCGNDSAYRGFVGDKVLALAAALSPRYWRYAA